MTLLSDFVMKDPPRYCRCYVKLFDVAWAFRTAGGKVAVLSFGRDGALEPWRLLLPPAVCRLLTGLCPQEDQHSSKRRIHPTTQPRSVYL